MTLSLDETTVVLHWCELYTNYKCTLYLSFVLYFILVHAWNNTYELFISAASLNIWTQSGKKLKVSQFTHIVVRGRGCNVYNWFGSSAMLSWTFSPSSDAMGQIRDLSTGWTFTHDNAIFFTSSTGYGHITPATYFGQSFSVIYALFGIPICGILLSALGDRLNKFKDNILQKVYRKLHKKWQRKIFSLVVITGSGIALFIFIPAYVFHIREEWSYHDAFYFCFITLTTVGFGDFVPGKKYP